MSFVLDNSIAIAWCFEDEQTPAILDLLQQTAEQGAYAPTLWPLEAANALLVAERRGRVSTDRRWRLMGFLQALPIALDPHTASRIWDMTTRLAEHHNLSTYDAAYLELAMRRNVPLATLDEKLRRAADQLGTPLLGT